MSFVLQSLQSLLSPRMRFFLLAIGVNNLMLVGRDLLVAYIWGTSLPLDRFQASQIIPVMVMTVCSFVMSGAFLPVYMRNKARGKEELADFSHKVLSSSQLVFSLIFLLSLIFNSGPQAFALSLYGLFFALATIPRMILIAEGRDRPVLVAPVFALAVGLIILTGGHSALGIEALSLSYIAFTVVEYVYLLVSVHRNVFRLSPLSLRFYQREFAMLQGEVGYLAMASLLMALSITVEQKIAMSFGAGALPHYNYATKICAMLAAVGGAAIKNYLFPRIAEACADHNANLALARTKTYILRYVILITPVCLLLSYFSTHLTHLLFERGAFHGEDTVVVGGIQAVLFLQIPTFFATTIAVQALLAAQRAKLVMISWLVLATFRGCGAYILSGSFGLPGIAMGVSFAQFLTALLTYWLVARTFKSGMTGKSAVDRVRNAS